MRPLTNIIHTTVDYAILHPDEQKHTRFQNMKWNTSTHLNSGALVRKRGVEESRDDIHHCDGDILFHSFVSVLTVVSCVADLFQDTKDCDPHYQGTVCMTKQAYHSHVHEEVFKQRPHVVAGVNLLHFNLCVNVAVVQEIDVGILHLWNKN